MRHISNYATVLSVLFLKRTAQRELIHKCIKHLMGVERKKGGGGKLITNAQFQIFLMFALYFILSEINFRAVNRLLAFHSWCNGNPDCRHRCGFRIARF